MTALSAVRPAIGRAETSAAGPVNLYWSIFRGIKGMPPILSAYCLGPRATELSRESEENAIEIVMGDLQRLFPKTAPRARFLGEGVRALFGSPM